jgi:hypothetical protein
VYLAKWMNAWSLLTLCDKGICCVPGTVLGLQHGAEELMSSPVMQVRV